MKCLFLGYSINQTKLINFLKKKGYIVKNTKKKIGKEITKLNKSISHSTNQNFSIEENAKSLIDAILNDTLDPDIQLWLLLIGESITNDNLINFVQDENNLYEAVLANQIKIINKRISDNDSIFLAKYMRCIIDGFCIELLYADVKSQAFMNFYKNLKANLIKLLINN